MEQRIVLHILVPILLALAMNALIYIKGWNRTPQQIKSARLLPPGYVIAIVWTVILGVLGYVHYKLYPHPAHWVVVATIGYCISYPVLTSGLKDDRAPLLNTVALLLAILVAITTANVQKEATVYTSPLLAWTSYVKAVDVLTLL